MKRLAPNPTSPRLWVARPCPLSSAEITMRQCKLGELCWLDAATRPDICACQARIASRVNSLQGNSIYRINELVKTAKEWQRAAVSKYAASPRICTPAREDFDGRMQARGEQVRCG